MTFRRIWPFLLPITCPAWAEAMLYWVNFLAGTHPGQDARLWAASIGLFAGWWGAVGILIVRDANGVI